MIENRKVTAIILVAGNSTRFGQNRNKNFELMEGKTVVSYSLKAFAQNELVDNIIVAAKPDEVEKVEEMIEQERITKKVEIVLGGRTRQESVYHSIKATNSEIVMIQDGARPAIKQEYINQCIENMKDYKGVTIGVKAKDTIKITDEKGIVIQTTKRSNTWVIQTPQCFERKVLLEMHEKYQTEEATDDCMLLEKGNYPVKIVEGDYTNLKITTYEDLGIMREMIKI